ARAREQPRLEPYLAPISQAERKLDAALLHAVARQVEPQLAGVCAWLAARVHAAQRRDELALASLSEARAGGLSGPITEDPALARLAERPELRRLFPRLPPDPAKCSTIERARLPPREATARSSSLPGQVPRQRSP